ncbi:fructokinase [Murinocardiopsis flavida]|uniref:Fructokinase n=1 Tax=Murinocardiopsis flavida TaxID=645275 RepID=A0A2P8DGX2_9ACTN|nr:carbohydrate kinase [Murinocardiopsis flavida]PSK96451.1 fructokinase [Murinocardiopsis flavida]
MITVVGETLIDLISGGSGTYRSTPGGAPANAAVTLARLGVPVTLAARIGDDKFGRTLRAYVASRGVGTRDLVAATQATTLAIANVDGTGSAEYDFYVRDTADWQWRPEELPDPLESDVTALHVGSLALAMAPGAAVLEEWIGRQRGQATVSYDPNVRPALAGTPEEERIRIERQVAMADIVKASDADLRFLYPDEEVGAAAERWTRLGPALVLVTQGGDDTLVLRGGPAPVSLRCAPPKVDVVDTVGAGDALAAGLLDALGQVDALGAAQRDRLRSLSEPELLACVGHAQLAAARTCERLGADPGPLDLPPVAG